MLSLNFIVIVLFCYVNSNKLPCPKVLTIDITNGRKLSNGSIVENDITFDKNNYFELNDTIYGCICNIKPCIRKCCGPKEKMIESNCTESDHKVEIELHNRTIPVTTTLKSNHYFIHSIINCKYGHILLMPHLIPGDKFHIQTNGSIYLPDFNNNAMRNPDEYCVDHFDLEEMEMNHTLSAVVCVSEVDKIDGEIPMAYSTGMIISMPFLLATFIAYALLPDRNLHMKALMFYVIDLMFSYLFLVIIQLSNGKFSAKSCTALGYLCLFFFLASFFWMNVICIDIWFAFSGLRGFSGSKKSAERKRFYIYCAYASITPIVLILIIYSISALSETHSWYNPAIGEGQCFLRRGYPELLYFYGPMAIIITINITFFVITAIKIRRVKKDTSMLKKEDSKRHSYENDKQNFNLYLKLLFAMGVNWSMEVISWAVGWAVGKAPDAIWYLSDFCNAIYGVFIFFIFVFKKNIWKLLKKRYYSFIGRPHLAHSLSSQNTTRTTSGYSTATALHDNPNGTGLNDTTTLTSEA